MDTSLFLAKAFGLYFIIVGLVLILKRKRLLAVVDNIIESPASLFIIAVITLILGILLILSHNIWVADWRVIITLLAWITFLAGLFRTFFPEVIEKAATHLRHNHALSILAAITLILGLYLCYVGFL